MLLPVASVREWELLGLASLEEEDKLEEARHQQRKATGDKIADPEWRPWLIRWKTNCSLCPGEHEPLATGFSRWAVFHTVALRCRGECLA